MTKKYLPHLPVHKILPELKTTLKNGHAILVGPPGSGKTTVVPLQLLKESWLVDQKILLLEPRRIAAKAAAGYMSRLLDESVGTTVGYRIRFEHKISKATRIEVVTEGILTRQIQNDPELTGVGLVIFDEFHERSLQADLGLALCLDLLEIRDDLRLLVMSATLDVTPLTTLINKTQVIRAEGKSYPVSLNYLQREDNRSIAMVTAAGIRRAWQEQPGDILAFLPGAGEIRATANLVDESLPDTTVLPLFGQLPPRQQQLIFHPDPNGNRRVILATSIAETSLTIEGISSVVDSGWSRLPAFDPGSGLSRLKTVRVSQATMRQRQGRAGRLGPGVCYRLWTKAIEHNFIDFHPPEIRSADLSQLVLELALWGVKSPDDLQWLDPPAAGHWSTAKELLLSLGAIDHTGKITPRGKKLVALPVHPRLAHMIMEAQKLGLGSQACDLAALLSERDILRTEQQNVDIRERLLLVMQGRSRSRKPSGAVARILRQSDALAKTCRIKHEKKTSDNSGLILSFGYPDRICKLRADTRNRYLLAGGRGATLPLTDLLCGEQYLVTPILHADQAEARIHLAAPVSMDDLMTHHIHAISTTDEIFWDSTRKKVSAYKRTRLGSIILSQSQIQNASAKKVEEALCQGIKALGLSCLGWKKKDRILQNRLLLLHRELGSPWPDVCDETLLLDLSWLVPYLTNKTKIEQVAGLDLHSMLLSTLPWKQQRELDLLAPTHIPVPSGSKIRLVYEADGSVILPVRLQEMFGQQETPTLCRGKVVITVHLLSPARRPLQVTKDLVSFWKNGYPLVKKEIAGRYPKHYWPDDPIKATATSGTKKSMMSRKETAGVRK